MAFQTTADRSVAYVVTGRSLQANEMSHRVPSFGSAPKKRRYLWRFISEKALKVYTLKWRAPYKVSIGKTHHTRVEPVAYANLFRRSSPATRC